MNWKFALEGVSGDEAFLSEVFTDLFRDAKRCREAAQVAIAGGDFKAIDAAAHEVKGSASYLGCEALRDASYNLEMVGKHGMKDGSDHNALIEEAKAKFVIFSQCLDAVRNEVISKGYFKEE